jgi:hypothetical protein
MLDLIDDTRSVCTCSNCLSLRFKYPKNNQQKKTGKNYGNRQLEANRLPKISSNFQGAQNLRIRPLVLHDFARVL